MARRNGCERAVMVMGWLITLKADGSVERVELDDEPATDDLNRIVGGWLELVPYFDSIVVDGVVCACIAFCNEEGKPRPSSTLPKRPSGTFAKPNIARSPPL